MNGKLAPEKKKKDQSNFGGGTHLALCRGSSLFGLGKRLALFRGSLSIGGGHHLWWLLSDSGTPRLNSDATNGVSVQWMPKIQLRSLSSWLQVCLVLASHTSRKSARCSRTTGTCTHTHTHAHTRTHTHTPMHTHGRGHWALRQLCLWLFGWTFGLYFFGKPRIFHWAHLVAPIHPLSFLHPFSV